MSTSSAARENRLQATLLVQAAEAGDFGAVKALIAAGVDVNSATEHGMTALMAAAANGHLSLVSFLLDSGAAFKAKRYDGLDALALAVFFGHLRIVRELLGRGADMKASDRLGTSPEMWATVRGFPDIVQVLTDAETTNSAEAVAHQSNESISPLSESISAQEPVLKEVLSSDQELFDRTLSQCSIDSSEVTIESSVRDLNRTEEGPKENQAQAQNWETIADAVAEVTHSRPAIFASISTRRPKALAVEKELASVDSPYVPKARYHHKRKSRTLMRGLGYITFGWHRSSLVDGSYVDSTYVAKPRYHHKSKSQKLVKWLAYITSDWQRLTVVTLIVMLVCGLGTVAV
ncbi:MAG: ankyrin repeat domain-containing protein, partial [Pyrinomonadaceae bacterium]